jgi:hypothetical protein
VDLDQDGLTDILSGSWPGDLYFFRRMPDGSFAKSEILRDKEGEPLNLGMASTVFAVDWDDDGDLDLLVGNINGKVFLVPNESGDHRLQFGPPIQLVSLEDQRYGDSHPIAADWDNDGDLDLLVGHSEGGVLLYRNLGTRQRPELAEPEILIPNSPSPWKGDLERNPNDWGVRAKICVTDWNGNGWLDILLGDRCGRFSDAPDMTPEELATQRHALEKLPAARKEWGETFREYRRRLADNSDNQRPEELAALRARMVELKEDIEQYQQVQARFEPQTQGHGFVWLFERKPTEEEKRE